MGYLPVFVDVTAKRCLVVGHGPLAVQRAVFLLEAGAHVEVVTEGGADEELAGMAEQGLLQLSNRGFQAQDASGAALVYVCVPDPAVRDRVVTSCRAAGAWVSTIDDAAHSDFVSGAVLRRGDVVVAVSTSGASPSLAVRTRDEIARAVGPGYARTADLLRRLRPIVLARISDQTARRDVFARLVRSELPALFESGRSDRVASVLRETLGEDFDPACVGVEAQGR